MKGLYYLKEWNENWHPEFFMTDFDTSEISVIEETFPSIIQLYNIKNRHVVEISFIIY